MAVDHDAISKYGPYEVVREIGRGGMGVVYEVVHEKSRSRYALKVLPLARSSSPRIVERFRREADATSRLRHRNIIGIHFTGCEQGLHYFVMDLIEGKNLEDIIFRLRRNTEDVGDFLSSVSEEISETGAIGPAPGVVEYSSDEYIRTVIRLIREVADALHLSHAAGLVHRDIKPSNLILSREGRLVLTDFGLVQDMQAQTFTQTGEVLGTPLYMSPEQIAGRSRKTSGLTDVYSLGATLYEALTLKAPFTGADLPSLVYQIQFVDPPSVMVANPGIPKALNDIVAQCMAKVPTQRYESAGKLAEDLGRFLNGQTVRARPPGRVSKFRQTISRHPEIKTALIVAVTIVILVLGYEVFDLVNGRRQGRSDFNSYASDSVRLLNAGDYGPAWRANEEAFRHSPDDLSVVAQRSRILQRMLGDVDAALESGSSLSEPLRIAQQMHSFAATHPTGILARQQVTSALKASIREQAVAQEYGLAQDLLERYRNLLRTTGSVDAARVGVNELKRIVARDLMEAAMQAYDSFRFGEIARHLEVADAFGDGVALPSPDTRLLQDFSSRGWSALQDVAARALSVDPSSRMRAISELGDPRVFVRLPYTATTRLVRRLLSTEKDDRLRRSLLDLVGRLGLNDMAGELLAMAQSSPSLEAQIVPVFKTARDPRCRAFLLDVMGRVKGKELDDAIDSIGSYRGAGIEKALTDILLETDSSERQALCCWSLARINAVNAGPVMLQIALKARGATSLRMVAALVKLRAQVSVEHVQALQAKNESVPYQVQCLRLLEGNTTRGALAFLVGTLNSAAHDEVRAEAALALGRCPSQASESIVRQVLSNSNEVDQLRIHAALALGNLPGLAATAALGAALQSDASDGLRLACARALGSRVGDAAASTLLCRVLTEDDNLAVRRESAFSLTRMGCVESIALFEERLKSYDPGGASVVINTLSDASSTSARAFAGLLHQIGVSDEPQETDGLRAEERLIIGLCQSMGAFARGGQWRDAPARRAGADVLLRLLTLPRAPDEIRIAALSALSGFPTEVSIPRLRSLLAGFPSIEIQREGILALARMGETERARDFFAELTDYEPMACFGYACIWGLMGNTSRAGIWLTKASMLGFDRVHLIRGTAELAAARRTSRVRVLFDL